MLKLATRFRRAVLRLVATCACACRCGTTVSAGQVMCSTCAANMCGKN